MVLRLLQLRRLKGDCWLSVSSVHWNMSYKLKTCLPDPHLPVLCEFLPRPGQALNVGAQGTGMVALGYVSE